MNFSSNHNMPATPMSKEVTSPLNPRPYNTERPITSQFSLKDQMKRLKVGERHADKNFIKKLKNIKRASTSTAQKAKPQAKH